MSNLTAKTKLKNAHARLEELDAEIARLEEEKDNALEASHARVRKAATGEGEYTAAEMKRDRDAREGLARDLRDLEGMRNAVLAAIGELEVETLAEAAASARQAECAAVVQANRLAENFVSENFVSAFAVAFAVLHDLDRIHRTIRYTCDRTHRMAEKAQIAPPPATVELSHNLTSLAYEAVDAINRVDRLEECPLAIHTKGGDPVG